MVNTRSSKKTNPMNPVAEVEAVPMLVETPVEVPAVINMEMDSVIDPFNDLCQLKNKECQPILFIAQEKFTKNIPELKCHTITLYTQYQEWVKASGAHGFIEKNQFSEHINDMFKHYNDNLPEGHFKIEKMGETGYD
jgi:phage/plasmid-associated DNA primase